MEGRWTLGVAAGLLGGMVGCSSPQVRSPAEVAKQPDPAALKQIKSLQQQQAAVAQERPNKDHKLKPETLVKLGALKEVSADEESRPQAERDAFRYQARQSYQKAIDQSPKYSPAYIALAGSYLRTGETDKAHDTFKKAVQANPRDAALWYEQGTVMAREKNWQMALECMAQAVTLDPENKLYQKTYGLTLARNGRLDEAYAALAHSMSEAEARFNIARMCLHMQQPNECREQLEMVFRANPGHNGARELIEELNGTGGVKPAKFEEPVKSNSTPAPTENELPPVVPAGRN